MLILTFWEIPHKRFWMPCPEGWFLRVWVSKRCSDALLPKTMVVCMLWYSIREFCPTWQSIPNLCLSQVDVLLPWLYSAIMKCHTNPHEIHWPSQFLEVLVLLSPPYNHHKPGLIIGAGESLGGGNHCAVQMECIQSSHVSPTSEHISQRNFPLAWLIAPW